MSRRADDLSIKAWSVFPRSRNRGSYVTLDLMRQITQAMTFLKQCASTPEGIMSGLTMLDDARREPIIISFHRQTVSTWKR